MDIYDLADFLWSYRTLAFVLAFMGVVGAIGVWITQVPAKPTYRLSLIVYTSGTPLRTAREIIEIVVAKLPPTKGVVTSDLGNNPLVIAYSEAADAEAARKVATEVEKRLVNEVEERASTLTKIPRSPTTLALILETDAFLSGYRSGLISLMQTRISVEAPPSKSPRNSILLLIASGFVFIVLAGTHGFVTKWQSLRDK